MQQCLQIDTMGGHSIIMAVSDAPCDPEATKKKIEPMLAESEEFKKLNELGDEKGRLNMAMVDAIKKRDNRRYLKIVAELKEIEQKLIIADGHFLARQKAILADHMVCSAPKNAILVDSYDTEDLKNKFLKLGPGEYLKTDGTIISKKQLELDILSMLTPTQRDNKKKYEERKLLRECGQYRIDCEIMGDSPESAIRKSQEKYKIGYAEIVEKYEMIEGRNG